MSAPEILAKRRYEALTTTTAILKDLAPRYGVVIGKLWANNHPGSGETNALTLLEALAAIVAQMDAELATLRGTQAKGGRRNA